MTKMNDEICNCKPCPGAGCHCGCQELADRAGCGCSNACGCAGRCACANA